MNSLGWSCVDSASTKKPSKNKMSHDGDMFVSSQNQPSVIILFEIKEKKKGIVLRSDSSGDCTRFLMVLTTSYKVYLKG